MSYTQKKISWLRCLPVDSKHVVFLKDSEDKELLDSEFNYLLASDSADEESNEYGDRIMDEYNDLSYGSAVIVLARHQPHEEVITTRDGRTVLTKSYFYIDPTIEPRALNIRPMDKLEGETVEQIYVMCTRSNKPRMVRFITV